MYVTKPASLESLIEKSYRSKPAANLRFRSFLIPPEFNIQPGLSSFAYSTVANSRINVGSEDYLDNFEEDLRDTISKVDALREVTDGAIMNLGLYLKSNKPGLDQHFNAVIDPNCTSILLNDLTDTRATWSYEYD